MKTRADASMESASSGLKSAMRTAHEKPRSSAAEPLGKRPVQISTPSQFHLGDRDEPQQIRLLTDTNDDKLPDADFASSVYRRNDSTNSYFENLYSYFIQQQQLDALPHRHEAEIVGAVLLTISRYLFALFIPVTLIIIGAIFIGKCPSQPFMPIWQLGFGGLLLLILLTVIIYMATSLKNSAHGACSTYCYYVCLILFVIVEFGWLILGLVIFTKIFYVTTFDDKTTDSYCQPFFFYSLFWELAISVYLVIFGLSDYFINKLKNSCTDHFNRK